MSRMPSPYETLGLRPGASREAVESAYRRLIKQHHPDLGGDGTAARAIIAAYRELRRGEGRQPTVLKAPSPIKRRRRFGAMTTMVLVAVGLLWWAPWPTLELNRAGAMQSATIVQPGPAPSPSPALLPRVDPDVAAVEAGVMEARRLRRQSPDQLPGYSRSCVADLQRLPSDALLDHCLGFDMAATLQLQLAGTEARHARRHLEAAKQVLQDPVLAQARVSKIRRLVEQRLLEAEAASIR